MKQAGWRFGVTALAFSTAFLVACQSQSKPNEPELPRRFAYEFYGECAAIKRAWEQDYVRLAKRRFAHGENVFLYRKTQLGSGPPVYSGLHDAEWNLTEVARAAIAKGGSWGVSLPDTGCPNISVDYEEHYIENYNRFALTLYAVK